MESLSRSFQNYLNIKLSQPLKKSGEIQRKDFRIKYILTKDASGKTVLDFLIFEEDGFPPLHKRIAANGELQELENFQFSVMYEFPQEREAEEKKLRETNERIATSLFDKGLVVANEKWIQKHIKH